MKILFCLIGLFIGVKNLKAYEVKLTGSVFKGERYEFAFAKFIDARLNYNKPVGYTRMGVSNRVEELVLNKKFNEYCDSVFNIKGIKYEGRIKLIPVFTQITIQETHSGGDEFSNVSLAMDFYKIEGDSCFLYYSSFTKVNSVNGFDITKKHGKNLSTAISVIFSNLNVFVSQESPLIKPAKISIGQLRDTLEIMNNTFHDAPLKEGIYFSCRDLINNEPSADFADLISNVDTSKNELFFSESTIFFRRNYFFAFVKKNTLYVHLKDLTYHRANIDKRNRLAYFKDLKRTRASIGAGIISAGLAGLFGLLGAAIGKSIMETLSKEEMVERLYLDMENGVIDINP